ncbi:sigma-70 family RNA polymerase sigma factor [Candidatus Poribacteria bacterium]|nr:sigma-70 family RNA polymerase sigma factor [Candidatus Poribacteria bacterium]
MVNDEELISRIKEGDKNSFDTLVKEYLPRTYKKVRMLVPDEDAEDVTQDIFLNLIRSIENFEGKSAFATWFNRIILNRIADYHRRMFRQKNRFVYEEGILSREPSSEDNNNNMEMEDLLMKMPEAYREVILMKVCDNLSFAEIASNLGVTYEAARSRYRRGIKYVAGKIKSDILITN